MKKIFTLIFTVLVAQNVFALTCQQTGENPENFITLDTKSMTGFVQFGGSPVALSDLQNNSTELNTAYSFVVFEKKYQLSITTVNKTTYNNTYLAQLENLTTSAITQMSCQDSDKQD